MATPTRPSPESGRIGWLFALLALAGLVFAVVHFGNLARFAEIARHAQPWWLLVGLLLQASTYVSVALGWRAVLARAGAPQPLRRLLRIALVKLFVDQIVPVAGIGGNVLLADRLAAAGAPKPVAMAAVLISVIGYYVAYVVLAVAMLAVLWLAGKASPLATGLVTVFILVAVSIPALALWLRHRGRHPLPAWVERLVPLRKLIEAIGDTPAELLGDRKLLARVSLFNALVFVADAATLAACLRAVGQPLSPGAAFVGFLAASIVAALGPIPMGLGSFEAASTATLRAFGIPVEAAFTATLLLRSMTLWLPLLPGLLLMRAVRRKPRRRAPPPR